MFLRQSTSQVIRFGPFVDSTDGVTAETILTIAQADMQLSKDGGAFAQKNAVGNATHDADGWYSTTLDTTDTATVGELYMQVVASGALPVWVRYWVIEEAIYDALYGASAAGFDANQRVDVGSWLGTAVTTSATTTKPEVDVNSVSDDATAANNLELDYDGTGYAKANSTIGTTTTNTDMRGTDNASLASVVGALTDAAAAGDPTTADTIMQYIKQLINVLIGTAGIGTWPASAAPANAVSIAEALRAVYDDTADIQPKVGTPVANLSTDIAGIQTDTTAIVADTNELQTDWANGGRLDLILDAILAMLDDPRAEPGQGSPPVNGDAMTKLDYLYKALRNGYTQTATTFSLLNDDGATVDQKAAVSDDGTTFTRGELVTGP